MELTGGNIKKTGLNREILRLSVPAIISNVTVPLLGLCDTAISGHLGEGYFLGAIAVGTMMLNVIVWLVGFLRMGTTGLVAQAFGRKDADNMASILTMSLFIAIIISMSVIILQLPLQELLMKIVGAETEVRLLAAEYFSICIWGVPAIMMTMAFTGWFIGRQSTFLPMIIAVASNVVNIIISYVLSFPLGLGFKGIAIGTLVANWCGLVMCIFAARRSMKGVRMLTALGTSIRSVGIRRFFGVNSDLFFRSACVMLVTMGVTSAGARLGNTVLATNAVMMQFFTFFSFFMDGFAFTGEALCGRYMGEKNDKMLGRCISALLKWAVGLAVTFTIIYLFSWKLIVSLLTDVIEIRESIADYKIFLLLIPATTVAAFIFDGFYIGLTKTRRMLVTALFAMVVFFSIVAISGGMAGLLTAGNNNWLWVAFLTYLFIRGAGLGIQLPGVLKRIKGCS